MTNWSYIAPRNEYSGIISLSINFLFPKLNMFTITVEKQMFSVMFCKRKRVLIFLPLMSYLITSQVQEKYFPCRWPDDSVMVRFTLRFIGLKKAHSIHTESSETMITPLPRGNIMRICQSWVQQKFPYSIICSFSAVFH